MTSLTVLNGDLFYSAQGNMFKNDQLIGNVSKNVYSIKYYNTEEQMGNNNACYQNGGCAHLCIPSGLNFRCACSLG